MQTHRLDRIRRLTIASMFIALIALMGFIPFLGFIPLGAGVSITLVHLPVLLGAALLDTKASTLFGLTFGVVSLLVVLTNPAPQPTDLFFINPLVSVLPRVLFGLIAGLLFSLTRRFSVLYRYGLLAVFALLATLTHTILVLTMLWMFEGASLISTFGNLLNFIWIILGLNGFIEAVIAALIIPTLTFALNRIPYVRQFHQPR
jgi:uncharacterized membrane protein